MISCTPKATYIQSKFEPLSFLLLTPVFFASVGIQVEISGLTGSLVLFSVLLLLISVISKMLGCGLGAKLCGFTGGESMQVGVGMVCRGEVALIVANRGLSLGVFVCCYDDSCHYHGCGRHHPDADYAEAGISQGGKSTIQETGLVDHYDKMEQLDIVSEKLLQEDQEYMEEKRLKDLHGVNKGRLYEPAPLHISKESGGCQTAP